MAFFIRTGNRLEDLAEKFRHETAPESGAGIFSPRIAVVGSQGMAAYLAQRIGAGAHGGIAFHLQTPFPTGFIDSILPHFLDDAARRRFRSDAPFFERGVPMLRIAGILARNQEAFPEFRDYLAGLPREVRLIQLSARLAELLESCSVHRPELFVRWRNGGPAEFPGEAQLARLFRKLEDSGRRDRSYYLRLMLDATPRDRGALPEKVGVFGLGSMPEIELDFFRKLAEYSDVFLYVLSPCREYWGEVRTRPERRHAVRSGDACEKDFEADHPLLSELGATGRDFFNLMLEKNLFSGAPEEECFVPHRESRKEGASAPNTLEQFQDDLLDQFHRRGDDAFRTPPADDSISVHNCDNSRREVEILHDELLGVLSEGQTAPRDIVVMAPDIARYAPLVNAVFGSGPLRDSYAICDRPLRAVSHAAEAFETVMRLHRRRGEAHEIMELLDFPVIRDRFDLAESNRSQLAYFLADGAIRWGEDETDRRECCGVAFREFSWREGLDRLLLGTAVEKPDFSGDFPAVPAGNAEGGRAELLGRFAEFAERVFAFREKLGSSRTPEQWEKLFGELLEELFSPAPEYAGELTALRSVFRQFAEHAGRAGFQSALPPEAVMEILAPGLTAPAGKQHFLRDKITFCSFLPMRSIPVPVVALLGLGDEQFPRRDREDGFSLPGPRRRGDPSPSREDRGMLLETLLAPRRKLMFFYSGHAADGREIPPCVPLAEIADTLREGYGVGVVHHRRQPFDPVNFLPGTPDRRSFSRLNFEGARILTGARSTKPTETLPAALPEPEEPAEAGVSADDLEKILSNACAEFLHHRFRLTPERDEPVSATDAEPLEPDALEGYVLRNEIFRYELEGVPPEKQYRILRLSGRLPVGELGARLFRRLHETVAGVPEVWRERLRSAERQLIDLPFGTRRIHGFITGNAAGTETFLLHFSAPRPKLLLRLRIGHLLMSLRPGARAPVTSYGGFLGADGKFSESTLSGQSPEAAAEELAELMKIRKEALCSPLPLFPESSFAYATAKSGAEAAAENAARRAFEVNYTGRGDAADPAVQFFFTPENFFTPEFRRLAKIVYRPFIPETEA